MNWWRNLSVSKKLYSVVGLMAMLIASELFTLIFAMNTMSSIRAFVMGEGLWSKAQKDAIHSLYQYALHGKERYFNEYKSYLKIPEGDHEARIALSKAHFNYNDVRQGFLRGGNNPHDIDGMIELLVRYKNNTYLANAISAWTQGDALLLKLQSTADSLHQAVRQDGKASQRVEQLLDRIARINSKMTSLEVSFSSSLGAGSRWMERVLMMILILTVLSVESTGLCLTFLFSRNLSRTLLELRNAAAEVGFGNFSVFAPVHSKDELGQLAESMNKMIRELKANVDERILAENQLKQLNEELEDLVNTKTQDFERSQRQFHLITNLLPEPVAQFDRQERCLYANEAFCSYFKFQMRSEVDQTISDILGKGYSVCRPYIERTLAGEVISFDEYLPSVGDSVEKHNLTLLPEFSSNGSVIGFVFLAVNVASGAKVNAARLLARKQPAPNSHRKKIG